MKKAIPIITAVFMLVSGAAIADCGGNSSGQWTGPPSNQPQFYFSSSCIKTSTRSVKIQNQICSVSESQLAFLWTKLNWASGSEGIGEGTCLVRRAYTGSALDIAGSEIRPNSGSNQITNVFVPDLGNGNGSYYEEVENAVFRYGGEIEPFLFSVQYNNNQDESVMIRATLVGEKPVFYIVLPADVKNEEDLRNLVSPDDINNIAPLVDFSSNVLENLIDSQEAKFPLSEFKENRQITDRKSIQISGDNIAEISFSVSISRQDIFESMDYCLIRDNVITTCFGGAVN